MLNGETVLYASAESLKETFEYDFQQEKQFGYRGLNQQETIEHIAHFISYLWQIHVFGEGNTRTVAIFLIKYLRTFGYTVNNELFEEHSWYFRNALVRANYKDHTKNIPAINEFLLRFFDNLLLGENHILKNRVMHVHYNSTLKTIDDKADQQNKVVRKGGQKRWSEVLELIKENPRVTRKLLSEMLQINPSAIQKHIQKLKNEGFIERVGGDKTGHWKIIEK